MQIAPLPPNEDKRLEALRQTGILDTEPEVSFDRLTKLAARICGAPIALITLVDMNRQWFKSHHGLDVSETRRDVAFCAHAILQPDILFVRDATKDGRFADNPLVTSNPKIRFYAGSPLVTHDGNALGTFCVIDTTPRDLNAVQVAALKTLSHHATILLELRRATALQRAQTSEFNRLGVTGLDKASAAALARLGTDVKHWTEARDKAELAFRELERSVQGIGMKPAQSPGGASRDMANLLGEIVLHSERVMSGLGSDHPLRADAARVFAVACQARDKLAESKRDDQERSVR